VGCVERGNNKGDYHYASDQFHYAFHGFYFSRSRTYSVITDQVKVKPMTLSVQ